MTVMTTLKSSLVLSACILAATAWPAAARADGAPRVPLLPAYVQECGACHVPFAPGLLPATSWRRLMAGLGRHFGSDASLDEATARTLADWLQANAGSGRRAAESPKDDRINQGAWFQREHREVQSRFGSAAIKSAADCAACHTRATEGRFGEREIRIPR